MSDNPADSLRRELEAALKRYWLSTWVERKDRTEQEQLDIQAEEYSEEAFDNIWPLVTAALEAARADERERLILALGSLDGKDFMEAPIHHRAEEAHAWASGHDAGVEAAAELVRAVSDGD